jgi:putative ABC transport system ATP-binding protein
MSVSETTNPLIQIAGLCRDYPIGGSVVHALRDVSLDIERGDFVAVTGPSGAGKSTLLHVVGCLDRATSGRYWLDGEPIDQLSPRQLAIVRNRKIGFVFQTFHLLPRVTALENVMLPLAYAGLDGRAAEERGRLALEAVGLADRAQHRPNQLSGGQQQRVAIARSLVTGPAIVLADEPTGNLDTRTSVEIMTILQELNDSGVTILVVTHEPDVAAYCSRVVGFQDGRIVDDVRSRNPRRAAEILPTMPVTHEQEALR